MNAYLVTVGTTYVSGFKFDTISNRLLYVKLNPLLSYSRLISTRKEADQLAAEINGNVICLAEDERGEL